MVELKGSLGGIGLPAIVQLIGDLHHSGTLQLARGDQQRGLLAFDDGRLVAAQCGSIHGLDAVAAIATDLSDADFTFVEGRPTLERTLDLGAPDLKKLLDRVNNGHFLEPVNGTLHEDDTEVRSESACPVLGFADDRTRHYARPTALHRCFAGGAPSLVSATEQRELCLAGRFTACPRYRTGDQPAPTVVEPVPAPVPPKPAASKAVPAGVAARMATAGQMRSPGQPAKAASAKPTAAKPARRLPNLPTLAGRSMWLVAGGVAAGLFLVLLALFVALPLLRNAFGQKSSSVAAPAATATVVAVVARPALTSAPVEVNGVSTAGPLVSATAPAAATAAPVAAATAAPAAVVPAAASPAATVAPTQTTVSRQPTPTAQTQSAAGPLGQVLDDIRFAAGPSDGWPENAPYAGWSDGAYRFQAKDATRYVAIAAPVQQVLSDVIVAATFRKTGGPPGGGYGVIVRSQGADLDGVNQDFDGYVLETGDVGEYGVWRRDGDHWVDLVPWSLSRTVRSGGSPNDLTVKAIGNSLTFTVNGTDLVTIQDDTFLAGRVGLFVGGDDNEVALDHFSVTLPQ